MLSKLQVSFGNVSDTKIMNIPKWRFFVKFYRNQSLGGGILRRFYEFLEDVKYIECLFLFVLYGSAVCVQLARTHAAAQL